MKKNRSFDLALILSGLLFAQEGLAQTTLEGHSDSGNSMVFSSTGNIFSSGSLGGDYRTWHLPDNAIMRLGKGAIGRGDRALGYSPDGNRLAVASTIGIWLYDVHTGAEVNLFPGGSVTSVAFSTDGALLASGSLDNTVQLWDVPTNTNIARLEGHSDGVRAVAFSPPMEKRSRLGRGCSVTTPCGSGTWQAETRPLPWMATARSGSAIF